MRTGLPRAAARLLTGPASRDGALPTLHGPPPTGSRPAVRRILPFVYGGLLVVVIALGLPRDPLALASLAFLGLGAQPPSPEWGLLLAENQPYAERVPCAVLAPAAVLSVLAVTAERGDTGGGVGGGPGGRRRLDRRTAAPPHQPEPPILADGLTTAGAGAEHAR
jgi:hypothetical protein